MKIYELEDVKVLIAVILIKLTISLLVLASITTTVLKLTGIIEWQWMYVLIPHAAATLLLSALVIVILFVAGIGIMKEFE